MHFLLERKEQLLECRSSVAALLSAPKPFSVAAKSCERGNLAIFEVVTAEGSLCFQGHFLDFDKMALKSQSAVAQVSSLLVTDPKISAPASKSPGVVPLSVKPKLQSSQLRRTKSRKPVKVNSKVTSALQVAPSSTNASDAAAKIGEDIATSAEGVLDAVRSSVAQDGPTSNMHVKRSPGKAATKTSRRRALAMCLALGMVGPRVSNASAASSNPAASQNATDLRRTVSAIPLRRTSSSSMSFRMPSQLVSQVSLATSLKQTNLLGEKEDIQKLTTIQ